MARCNYSALTLGMVVGTLLLLKVLINVGLFIFLFFFLKTSLFLWNLAPVTTDKEGTELECNRHS